MQCHPNCVLKRYGCKSLSGCFTRHVWGSCFRTSPCVCCCIKVQIVVRARDRFSESLSRLWAAMHQWVHKSVNRPSFFFFFFFFENKYSTIYDVRAVDFIQLERRWLFNINELATLTTSSNFPGFSTRTWRTERPDDQNVLCFIYTGN